MRVAVFGGGAAGVFAAITAANKESVVLFEKSNQLLSKVKISGGGRCNVTHAEFDPKRLVKNYPRGERELLGPFTKFSPADTIDWFSARGVLLKTESDGRIFPVTDLSETIIKALLEEMEKRGVEIRRMQKEFKVESDGEGFLINGEFYDRLILATGSHPSGYELAKSFGHTIEKPIPSLFTLNVPTSPLLDLAGVTVSNVEIKAGKITQQGPLLLTHWGFSGPAALKLSAFAARDFFQADYSLEVTINWAPGHDVEEALLERKKNDPKQQLGAHPLFGLPKQLWRRLISHDVPIGHLSHAALRTVATKLTADSYQVSGKTTNKEEFVTCGGVALKEVDFRRMESRLKRGLFFAGEILDIDGITGGFNFQNAWTTGFIAGTFEG